METINKERAKELINNSNGRIFSATFTKKDFTRRLINARLGVKYQRKTERKEPYNPFKKGLLCDYLKVYDMNKKGYRTINLKTLITLSINKNTYAIE